MDKFIGVKIARSQKNKKFVINNIINEELSKSKINAFTLLKTKIKIEFINGKNYDFLYTNSDNNKTKFIDAIEKNEDISLILINNVYQECLNNENIGIEDYISYLNKLISIGINYAVTYNNIEKDIKMLTAKQKKYIDNVKMDLSKQKYKLYFRGVNNYLNKNNIQEERKLVSGIYRTAHIHDENYYFNNIQVECSKSFENKTNLEKLVYMQHYGCPTRLIDITSNPLVALYFACEKTNVDGYVYVLFVPEDNILYEKSDKVQMLSKFAEFREEEQILLRNLALKYIHKDDFPISDSGYNTDELGADVLERFYYAVQSDNPAFRRCIKPIDLLKPCFVQPKKDNNRIIKQDGAFIISGLDENDADSNFKISNNIICKIKISAKQKQSILDSLKILGINKATLFPEVDKVAEYLKET